MPEVLSPVIQVAQQYQAQLARGEMAAAGRLIDAYQRAYVRLSAQIEALLMQAAAAGGKLSMGQLTRLERYKTLMGQLMQELAGFQALTANEIEIASELGITLGSESMGRMISALLKGDTSLAVGFNRLPVEAIKTLLGFLEPGGPLYKRLVLLAPNTAEAVMQAIIQGVTLGWNPRKIAAAVQQAFGRGLSDALRFVRTAQLWAYREANRANMLANRDVVDGWVWFASLGDPRTCMSCVAMHGTPHPVEEVLNDHHNGRCTAVPMVKGFDNPVKEIGTEWFGKQSEAAQRAMLGPGKYAAWRDGKFGLEQLSAIREDSVYGPMRVEQTLKELIGATND